METVSAFYWHFLRGIHRFPFKKGRPVNWRLSFRWFHAPWHSYDVTAMDVLSTYSQTVQKYLLPISDQTNSQWFTILCVLWKIKCICRVIRGNFLVTSKSADLPLCVTLAMPSPDNGRIAFILAINASSLLCEEPSVGTIVFDVVKYAIYTSYFSFVLLIALSWFYCIHFETCTIYCRKIMTDDIVVWTLLIHTLVQK